EVYGGVILWVALRDQRFSWLEMQGPGAAASPVPYLFALAGRYASAAGLFEPSGAAFLMRPPGEAPPAEPVAESPSFELFVRGLGADGGLARHLLAEVRAWDAAGRPGARGLRILAYPVDVDRQTGADEIVVVKRWTRFVLSWSPSPDRPPACIEEA